MKTQITCTLAALMIAGAAQASDIEWANPGQSGDWNVDSNWVGGNVPTASDKAILPKEDVQEPEEPTEYTVTVDVNNAVAQAVDLQHETAELLIADGGTLSLGDGSDVASNVDGPLTIQENGTLLFLDSPTVAGAKSIVGEGQAAKLQVAGSETLTSEMTIQGGLTIERDGTGSTTFTNTGLVWANGDNTIELGSDLAVRDGSTETNRWKVGNSNDSSTGLMIFNNSAPFLEGHFVLEVANSAFQIGQFPTDDVDVETAGGLIFDCGTKIDIEGSGSSLKHDTNDFVGDCDPLPPATITSDYDCDCT